MLDQESGGRVPDEDAQAEPAWGPRRHRWPGRPTCPAMGAISCILGLATTACSGGHTAKQALSFVPANGSKNVSPGQGITVRATQGKLSSVTVTTSGDPVSGTLNAAGTAWHSTNPTLDVSQRYTVTAKAAGTSGQTFTRTSAFRTL